MKTYVKNHIYICPILQIFLFTFDNIKAKNQLSGAIDVFKNV